MANLQRASTGRTAEDYTIVVAYDGERTEDDYFRGWSQIIPANRLTLVPVYVRSGGNPLEAVQASKKAMRGIDGFAEFWCVCDADGCDQRILAKAQDYAKKYGIRLCLSNRCFEIWIKLHFEPFSRPISNEKEAIACVAEHIDNYGDPYKSIDFYDLYGLTSEAIKRAEQLEVLGLDNPSTAVHNLVRKLMQNCT